jgi:hypothetical protein
VTRGYPAAWSLDGDLTTSHPQKIMLRGVTVGLFNKHEKAKFYEGLYH